MSKRHALSAYEQLILYGVSEESARAVQASFDDQKAQAEALAGGAAALCIWCKAATAFVGNGLPYCQACPHCRCCGDKIPHVRAVDHDQCAECDRRDLWADERERQGQRLGADVGSHGDGTPSTDYGRIT